MSRLTSAIRPTSYYSLCVFMYFFITHALEEPCRELMYYRSTVTLSLIVVFKSKSTYFTVRGQSYFSRLKKY